MLAERLKEKLSSYVKEANTATGEVFFRVCSGK